MTIEEKRQALINFCGEQNGCRSCPLYNGCGECSFDGFNIISAENVERAYNLAYNSEKKTTNLDTIANPIQREEINHPDRYISGGFECIDVMLAVFGEEAVQNFCVLNAFKYIWRHNQKGGAEDIKKAVWYLNKFVELEGMK